MPRTLRLQLSEGGTTQLAAAEEGEERWGEERGRGDASQQPDRPLIQLTDTHTEQPDDLSPSAAAGCGSLYVMRVRNVSQGLVSSAEDETGTDATCLHLTNWTVNANRLTISINLETLTC